MVAPKPQRGGSTPTSGLLGHLRKPTGARHGGRMEPPAVAPPQRDNADDATDDLDDFADLAPTTPSLPAIRRIPRSTGHAGATPPPSPMLPPPQTPQPTPADITIAADWSEYVCGQDWMHTPALGSLAIEKRMRIFSMMARVYLPVLEATGRNESPGRMAI